MHRSGTLILLLIALVAIPAELVAQPTDAEGSLRATELAFARSVAEKNLEAFKSFIDEDAVFASGPTLRGPEEVVKAWSYYFGPDAPPLVWCPKRVEVLASGALGMTTGPYETLRRAENGDPERVRGVFFSVWRRQPDESWKIVFDSGTPASAVPGEAAPNLDCMPD